MAFSGSGIPVFQWTNPKVRYPSQWIITPYFKNSAITADIAICYSEASMQDTFGAMTAKGIAENIYDQIKVVRYDNVVPSAGVSGVSGDVITTE